MPTSPNWLWSSTSTCTGKQHEGHTQGTGGGGAAEAVLARQTCQADNYVVVIQLGMAPSKACKAFLLPLP